MSVFSGVGIFASERPQDATGLDVDWVACDVAYATPSAVMALKHAGKMVFAWEERTADRPTVKGQQAVRDLGADGYVWTVETQAQLASIPEEFWTVPKAIICNTTASPFPRGWHCIAEAYAILNPLATADQMVRDMRARGATEISVCVLPSDGGKRVPVSWYEPQIKLALDEDAVGVSVFRSETLGPGDADYLGSLRALIAAHKPPPPPAPPPPPPAAPPAPSPAAAAREKITLLAKTWERSVGGPSRHARLTVIRRVAQASNTDARWTQVQERIAALLDSVGLP